jgi:hypothetical protein
MIKYSHINKLFLWALLSFLLTDCHGQNVDNRAWPSDFLQMPVKSKEDSLPDANSEEAKLTLHYCSQCHDEPSPSEHSSSDWTVIMRQMMLLTKRSNNMGSMGGMMGSRGNMPMGMIGAEVPTQEQQKEILSYLQAHSMKTITEKELPDASNKASEEFKTECALCHALPSPYQHTQEQWPKVVERMRRHMKESNLSVISNDEANSIIKYLRNALQHK